MPLPRPLKRISLRSQDEGEAAQIAKKHQLSTVTGRVLAARGYRPGSALSAFLSPQLSSGLVAPEQMLGLEQACRLIAETIKKRSPIAICSDFDVDGLTGASQLVSVITEAGGTAFSFVPDRFRDGYGLNTGMVDEAKEKGCELLVAVDFGTKNAKEILYAKKHGLTTVVVDHHHVGDEVCPADVFVNPQQQECGFADGILCAAGLCWYLIIGLRKALRGFFEVDPKRYLDLAVLGTICDMVPLIGVNRVIARRGLDALAQSQRPGIVAFREVLGIHGAVKGYDVGFGIGPRINAAGRLVHGSVVVELLTTQSMDRARELARTLHHLNEERQTVERKVKEEALRRLDKQRELPWGTVVWDADFHTGVIGIVAQRLTEEFHRPTAVIGGGGGGVYKGSVRGIKGVSVVEALEKLGHYLISFGGHVGAGGFSIRREHLESFRDEFAEEIYRQVGNEEGFIPRVHADATASLGELTFEVTEEFSKLSPFGVGNRSPILCLENLEVVSLKELKSTHLKVGLASPDGVLEGVLWRHRSHPALKKGKQVRVACKPELNTFRGATKIQLNIQAAEAWHG